MKSICLFSGYFISTIIPNYVQYYLKELTRHFTKVVFVTNEKKLSDVSQSFLQANNIESFFVTNEGYDFGMWYKAMMKYDVEQYDRLGLVNDSCILFKPLDDYFNWLNGQNIDFAGINDSYELQYHIQSFFLTINKPAIKPTLDYFKEHGIQTDRRKVIKVYELGLSKHLYELGLKSDALFLHKNYLKSEGNPTLYAVDKMIKNGYPFIKKKIIFSSFEKRDYPVILCQSFNHDPTYYIELIKKANENKTIFDFNLLYADGYERNSQKIRTLQLLSVYYHIKRIVLFPLRFILIKLKLLEPETQL